MADESKKRKKGYLTEQETIPLFHRYSAQTVLTLLVELDRVATPKIDWNAMVKNTATGITNAREYQMLWRHYSYGHALEDNIPSDAEPLDDESDLEFEPGPSPFTREEQAEAAAGVKLLMESHANSLLPSNESIEVPLTVNIPSADSEQGKNVIIPIWVKKQPGFSGACGEKGPNNETTAVNIPPRKKRRGWSAEEDLKLTAAVEKYGERNWANIARGDFENERKAQELSQRWANLRKKQGNTKVGTNSQLSETQLAAAHRAMSLALDMPMGDNLKSARQINIVATNSHRKDSSAAVGPPKLQLPTARPHTNPPAPNPDSLVKAAAVAAGARIASSADASFLMEAARSQNVVHIKTGTSSATTTTNQLPSNVHFIRDGLAKAPISAAKPIVSQPGVAKQIQVNPTKLSASAVGTATGPTVPVKSMGTAKTMEDSLPSTSATQKTELVGVGEADSSGLPAVEQIPVDQSPLLGNPTEERVEKHESLSSGEEKGNDHFVDKSGEGKSQEDTVEENK